MARDVFTGPHDSFGQLLGSDGKIDPSLLPPSNVSTAVLTSDVGPIASQTALTDITGLGLTIGGSATEIWRVTWWLIVEAANATMDARFGFTVPTGTTMKWGVLGGLADAVASWSGRAVASIPITALIESNQISLGTAVGISLVPLTAVVFSGNTAGNVQPRFAQSTSDPGNLKIDKGSLMEATKVAN
jgi:hypothetical protein